VATGPTEFQIISKHFSIVAINNPNRYRVSSKFTLLKVFLPIGLFFIAFNLVREWRNNSLSTNEAMPLVFAVLMLVAVFYFVKTRKIIEYDDIKQVLYVADPNGQPETEIPVENISNILCSTLNLGGRSYIIIYKDSQYQTQKVRLFPIPFSNDINTIITDTKLKNPGVVIRRWSFGINELFD